MERKIVLVVCALMCVLAVVTSAAGDGKKRGIIVKCQGNPVSCYGKRSSPSDLDMLSPSLSLDDETNNQQQFSDDDDDENNQIKERTQDLYKFFAHKLLRNCKLGVRESCLVFHKIFQLD